MEIPIFEVNAFTQKSFGGNPAAVCPLNKFLPDDILQSIAEQNNLPETAFIVPRGNQYSIRWFSPNQEVNLCGHATLAAAYVLFHDIDPSLNQVEFDSKSGILRCKRENNFLVLDFPARPSEKISPPPILLDAINYQPISVLGSDDYLVILENQSQIENLKVDMDKLAQLDRRGVVFSAKGNKVDFVSRVFHPKLGIGEDPVCGSAHCELMPYWSKIFNKSALRALQLSSRGGELFCEINQDRVFLKGQCKIYLKGKIYLT